MARIAVFLILIGLFGACCSDKKDAAESISLTRYDRDLTAFIQTNDTNAEKNFLDRYSIFHPLYVSEILHLSPNDSSEKDALIQRLSQADMQILYRAADSLCLDTSEIEKELSEAFSRYKKLMPDDTLPAQLYCHISGLQQQIVNIDTILSISIDHYLGGSFVPYHSIFNPYQLQRKEKVYIVPDVLRVILYTRHPIPEKADVTLLGEMIYEGKIICCLQQILPDVVPEFLFGYTKEQLQWCQENEPIMWNTLLKQKDLYSTDRFLISKYLSPAPFTAPFTQQSPGQAGRYIGWRIVSEYMRQTGNELPDLWKENNEMNILKTAKYKG